MERERREGERERERERERAEVGQRESGRKTFVVWYINMYSEDG